MISSVSKLLSQLAIAKINFENILLLKGRLVIVSDWLRVDLLHLDFNHLLVSSIRALLLRLFLLIVILLDLTRL